MENNHTFKITIIFGIYDYNMNFITFQINKISIAEKFVRSNELDALNSEDLSHGIRKSIKNKYITITNKEAVSAEKVKLEQKGKIL